ncbi:N-6 DNA methylase [Sulfobacillus harzensis]|uniref:N-6 DNA methylase n=1 Tax=Sulfobacillus harzensis TaxID=2729629 RepID=A0A7Y0L7R7_9FIRM|nr:N-6 DNA methylase [Sulfobacillus harzensis]NMP23985.1 N-6 DNA methylase [Sulfobacillus harzensis]
MAPHRHREEVINTQLAVLLSRYGVHADAEVILQRGQSRPDVLFVLRGLRVTIEGKFADHNNAQEAVLGDAQSRVRTGIAHVAAAVVYDETLRTTPTDELLDQLDRSPLTYCIVSEFGITEWFQGTPGALMDALRRAQDILVQEDIVAKTARSLADRLDGIATLWIGQVGVCDRLSQILGVPTPPGESAEKAEARRETAAKVAALVIANALIFQEQLATTDGRIDPIRKLLSATDVARATQSQWQWIWQNINYVPIFQLGDRVLFELPASAQTLSALKALVQEAAAICSHQAALRHDLMGRIYHWLLHEAKYLGTFYTAVSTATLLLNLALAQPWDRDFGDPRQLAEFHVADLACGTGTLLMAASQAITDQYVRARAANGRTLNAVDLQTLHRTLMENILYGYDVLPSAIHLTASTLALLAPEVAFVRMNLYVMPMGMERGQARLGSLDFLGNRDGLTTQITLDDSQLEITKTAASKELVGSAKIPDLDLCVMNPPFVRSVGGNLLFGSLPDERGKMQAALKKVVRNTPASITAGLGSVFVALADQHVKPGGRLAFVLPHALASGEAWGETRALIADKYHLEMVITSHDADRPNFSENTDLSELLFIARKLGSGETPGETTYVSLWHNPTTIHGAMDLAEQITHTGSGFLRTATGSHGERYTLPRAKGPENWFGALFAQGQLAMAFDSLRGGEVHIPGKPATHVPLCPLHELGTLGPDRRRIHEAFDLSYDIPSSHPAFWDHDASAVRTINQTPNAWLHPRTEPRYADRKATLEYEKYPYHLWTMASPIVLAERLWTITQRVIAVNVEKPVLGNTWWPLITNSLSPTQQRALLLWLNSTPGLLLFYGHRVVTRGPWVQMKKPAWLDMPVLNVKALREDQLATLSAAYDQLAGQELKPLAQLDTDSTRQAIDEALCAALDLPDLQSLRELLAREPGLTGKPLGRRGILQQTSLFPDVTAKPEGPTQDWLF